MRRVAIFSNLFRIQREFGNSFGHWELESHAKKLFSKTLDVYSLNQHFSASPNMDPAEKVIYLQRLSNFSSPFFLPYIFREFTASDAGKSILLISYNDEVTLR